MPAEILKVGDKQTGIGISGAKRSVTSGVLGHGFPVKVHDPVFFAVGMVEDLGGKTAGVAQVAPQFFGAVESTGGGITFERPRLFVLGQNQKRVALRDHLACACQHGDEFGPVADASFFELFVRRAQRTLELLRRLPGVVALFEAERLDVRRQTRLGQTEDLVEKGTQFGEALEVGTGPQETQLLARHGIG